MKSLITFLLVPVMAFAQLEVERKSIHQLESELHRNDPVNEAARPAAVAPLLPKLGESPALAKKVYGWHPYWASSTAYLSYDYGALSHIAYFSYETDTATGGYTRIHAWNSTPIIDYAHQRGVKVTLTVTNFGSEQNNKLLSDTVKQQTMINTLISLLQARNGDGVNFDLESVPNTQRSNLVAFMRRAATQIKAQLPNAEISMATPAVDWSGSWDFAQLAQICDYLIVMGYDYYWKGSKTAGPVAPLEGETQNITKTIDTYVGLGVPRERLLLGVPWYGLDWPVRSSTRKDSATDAASSRTYIVAEPMATQYGKTFDQLTKVPWFSYQSESTWRQVWYDDSLSLALKYNLVNARSLGGIGIWALSYDGGRSEIWNGIRSAFTVTDVRTVEGEHPAEFQLLQNYPNPFNASTTIAYRIPAAGHVSLKVYDVFGREIAALVDGYREPGSYSARFGGHKLSVGSGTYFYRLVIGSFAQTKKMLLIQ
ncbi:MAG: T9SS type A sorting domain-containing protein [Ignavibacteria bacterium]|nr:T9SS type A sorting domain-containing protein [Ignavibacteria bacterium]